MDGDILHRHSRETPAFEPASEDKLVDWAQARGGRLLVVDDSATNRILTASLMRKAGFTVETAEGGAEAITAVSHADQPYDAVLMDIAMPEVDGIAATRAIRGLPGARGNTPIIAVTAHGFAEDRERCLDAGMNAYVVKPVRRTLLLAALHSWL